MGNNFLPGKVIGKLQNILPKTEGFSSYFLQECAGGKKKIEGSSAVFRGFLLKDRKKKTLLFEVLVCCYQACNVLQFLIGTTDVTACTTLASAS